MGIIYGVYIPKPYDATDRRDFNISYYTDNSFTFYFKYDDSI